MSVMENTPNEVDRLLQKCNCNVCPWCNYIDVKQADKCTKEDCAFYQKLKKAIERRNGTD